MAYIACLIEFSCVCVLSAFSCVCVISAMDDGNYSPGGSATVSVVQESIVVRR